jgi:UDP-N-acetylmuramate dehydrogenase
VSDGIRQAEAILRAECGDRVRTRFPIAPLTSFRIGGPAALYLEPERDEDLVAAGEAVRETNLPFVVVGKGSNILVADAGFAGLVLRLGRGYRWAARDGDRLTGGGAMPLPALAGVALGHALAGLEFGVAIPASLGGGVRMNAGAHGSDVSSVVEEVAVFELLSGARRRLAATEVGFRYRGTDLPADAVVVAATAHLSVGDAAEIRARIDEAREWRRGTQPLAEPNCGSVFTNPRGDHAARLIDEAGLKGFAIGGASVSRKHANFIVAGPGSTAADVVALIHHVQETVAARTGVRLEPEVRLVGDLDPVRR